MDVTPRLPPVAPGARLAGRAACLGALLAAARVAAASPVSIDLHPQVEVAGRVVALGQVAAVSGPAAVRDRLQALTLGPAPRAGSVARLERAALARWIRLRGGVEPSDITWAGAGAVEIRRTTGVVQGKAIAECASGKLRAAAEQRRFRAELSVLSTPRDVEVVAGAVELRARPVPAADLLARRLSVWVEVWVDGRFMQAVPVAFELGVFAPAYVSEVPQAPGQALDPSSLQLREVEWTASDVLPPDPDVVARLRLRRPLAAGATLTRAHVEAAPLVARGSSATLLAVEGAMQLEGRVEVLEDGQRGQLVRVRTAHSTVPFLARVVGPDRLEVAP